MRGRMTPEGGGRCQTGAELANFGPESAVFADVFGVSADNVGTMLRPQDTQARSPRNLQKQAIRASERYNWVRLNATYALPRT